MISAPLYDNDTWDIPKLVQYMAPWSQCQDKLGGRLLPARSHIDAWPEHNGKERWRLARPHVGPMHDLNFNPTPGRAVPLHFAPS